MLLVIVDMLCTLMLYGIISLMELLLLLVMMELLAWCKSLYLTMVLDRIDRYGVHGMPVVCLFTGWLTVLNGRLKWLPF